MVNKAILVIGLLALAGCMGSTGKVIKTKDGVIMTVGTPGKISYKDKDVEASYDTKSSSVVDDVLKLYTIKKIEEK